MRLTFKKEPRETGLSSVARPYPATTIKADGKPCGRIAPPRYDETGWRVGFAVEANTGNPNCDWQWIFWKRKFETEGKARKCVTAYWEDIQLKYALHLMEETPCQNLKPTP